MDHVNILSSYIVMMSYKDLHILAEKRAKVEYAKLFHDEKQHLLALEDLKSFVQETVQRIDAAEPAPAAMA